MIIWIASYPRSGNTLLRAILKRCFDAESYSRYDSIESEAMQSVTGHVFHAQDAAAFIEKARADAGTYFIKTHELPPAEDDLALYIVRDGRAALESHRRYLQDISLRKYPLGYLVVGSQPFVTWSDHVLAWTQRPPGRTLLLRYENLVKPDKPLLDGISKFIGLPVRRPFDLTFSDMKAINALFFRTGNNDRGIAEVEQQCPTLFWSVNGDAMQRLGYDVPAAMPPPIPQPLLSELRVTMRQTRNRALSDGQPPAARK